MLFVNSSVVRDDTATVSLFKGFASRISYIPQLWKLWVEVLEPMQRSNRSSSLVLQDVNNSALRNLSC